MLGRALQACDQVRAPSLMKIAAMQFGFGKGKGKVKAPNAVTRPTIVPQPSYNIPAVLLGALSILACLCAFSPVMLSPVPTVSGSRRAEAAKMAFSRDAFSMS